MKDTDETEPKVTFEKDLSGLFCLDTTPEVAKQKPLGPRFHRVILVFNCKNLL